MSIKKPKKYKSEISETIHEMATGLHEAGFITDEKMDEYDNYCLVNVADKNE